MNAILWVNSALIVCVLKSEIILNKFMNKKFQKDEASNKGIRSPTFKLLGPVQYSHGQKGTKVSCLLSLLGCTETKLYKKAAMQNAMPSLF